MNLFFKILKRKYDHPKSPKKWYLNAQQLTCHKPLDDDTFCEYTVMVEAPYIEAYLDINCPKCGRKVLTREIWKSVVFINWLFGRPIVKLINWWGKITNQPTVHFSCKIKEDGMIDLSTTNKLNK